MSKQASSSRFSIRQQFEARHRKCQPILIKAPQQTPQPRTLQHRTPAHGRSPSSSPQQTNRPTRLQPRNKTTIHKPIYSLRESRLCHSHMSSKFPLPKSLRLIKMSQHSRVPLRKLHPSCLRILVPCVASQVDLRISALHPNESLFNRHASNLKHQTQSSSKRTIRSRYLSRNEKHYP